MSDNPFISVMIKTFNEATSIEKTIDSIRCHIADHPHQIIVADSLSTDNTQQLASAKGVTVVSLTEPLDRCCGVGHQLGYLYSQGDYLLLLDGDMVLEEGFIEQGIAFLAASPEYAGVAGMVAMDGATNYEFTSRKQRIHKIYPLGDCDHLGGGGLYRRSAIEKIGYLTHRGLHGYEEAELGIRLHHVGYQLHRLNVPYFRHASYTMPTLKMLQFRWKNGYLWAPGELLRSSWRKPYFYEAVKIVKNEAIFTMYLLVLLIVLLTFNLYMIGMVFLPLLVFIVLKTIKNRSFFNGVYGVINLAMLSAGLAKGLTRPMCDPMTPPGSKVIHE